MAEATAEYKVIGTRPIRPDGADKVTGRAIYGGDMHLTGMLHGKVLRSPHAHARIKSIDTSEGGGAARRQGRGHRQDFPAAAGSHRRPRRDGGERQIPEQQRPGARQGAVQGPRRGGGGGHQRPHRRRSAELIEVEYEVLPAVLDVLEAMKEDAPLLHDDMTTTELGQEDGQTQQHRHPLPVRAGRRRRRAFARPTWSLSASSTPRPSTRATSSRTTPRRCGTRMAI